MGVICRMASRCHLVLLNLCLIISVSAVPLSNTKHETKGGKGSMVVHEIHPMSQMFGYPRLEGYAPMVFHEIHPRSQMFGYPQKEDVPGNFKLKELPNPQAAPRVSNDEERPFKLPEISNPQVTKDLNEEENQFKLPEVAPLFPSSSVHFNPTVPCTADQFNCGDSLCLPKSWVCDGDPDCLDGGDELNCEQKNCSDSRFRCSNNICIPLNYVCDGNMDCLYAEDEQNCAGIVTTSTSTSTPTKMSSPLLYHGFTTPASSGGGMVPAPTPATAMEEYNCPALTFKCISRQGSVVCIPDRLVCNVEEDCADGSDEANCPNNDCNIDEFKCLNPAKCIPKSWVCDGQSDCTDASDEKKCSTKINVNTTELLSEPMETTIHSISISPIENSTAEVTCSSSHFRCDDGRCILSSWMCDGDQDCPRGEDEKKCPVKPAATTAKTTMTTTTTTSEPRITKRTTTTSKPKITKRTTTTTAATAITKRTKPRPIFPTRKEGISPSTVLEVVTKKPEVPKIFSKTENPRCDMNICSPCFTGVSMSRCPQNYHEFEGLCLLINPFPRKWLRAREICKENNAHLAELPNDDSFLKGFYQFLKSKAMTGLNYWVEKPNQGVPGNEIQEKEMQIPSWLLNGRMTNGHKFPAYQNECYFLDYYDFKHYKSSDCNEHGGFICLWNKN